jgi:hypothetical protein
MTRSLALVRIAEAARWTHHSVYQDLVSSWRIELDALRPRRNGAPRVVSPP